jgi:hypothetical protein
MKCNNQAIVMALAAAMLLIVIQTAGTCSADGNAQGTRSGTVGWQYDTFAQNMLVEVTPEEITTLDRITVTVSSKVLDVWVKQAAIYGVVYPNDGIQFPFSFPFLKKSDTVFECTIEPFPLNGYRIDFYIVAYDYFFAPIDSRDSMTLSYNVVGSGWKYDGFDDNIILEYWPLRANATEEVTVTIRSRNNVTISGANLYVVYETPEGDLKEGGWNFTKSNANSTEMRRVIPGNPAGTNVTFWVTAWDQYNAAITSRMYNYSVMGISEYTNFPFEYTDESGDRRIWIPDNAILLPMAGMTALAIPLFIYLYALDAKRRKRAVDLIKAKQSPALQEEPEVGKDE